MIIPGYRYDGSLDYWAPNGAGSVIIDYDQDFHNTMISGQEDRFFVSGVHMDSSNFESVGVEVGSTTTVGATTVTLTGLTPGRDYYLFGARYASTAPGAAQTGDYSNCEIFFCPSAGLRVFPANTTKTYDPGTDDFFDAFHPEYIFLRQLKVTKGNDGALGDFWRLSGDFSEVGISSHDDASYSLIHGLDYISPRHNWSVEFTLRHNGPVTGASNREQQFQAGIKSGDQCQFMMDYYTAHNTATGGEGYFFVGGSNWDTSPDTLYDPFSTIASDSQSNYHVGFQASIQHTTYPAGVLQTPTTRYLLHADTDSDSYADRYCPPNQVNKIRWNYNATTYELSAYLNDVLICTFGETEGPLRYRRRHLAGQHLGFGVTAQLAFYFLGAGDYIYGAPVYIDIGEVKITSECPYAFAQWVANRGYWKSGFGALLINDLGNQHTQYIDPSVTEQDSSNVDVCWFQTGTNRYTCEQWAGLMVKHHTESFGTGEHWPNNFVSSWSYNALNNQTRTVALEKVNVPAGHAFHSAFFNGLSGWHGHVKGRIVNEAKTIALTNYTADLTEPDLPAIVNAINSAPDVVRPQFQIQYQHSSDPLEYVEIYEKESMIPIASGAGMYFQPLGASFVRAANNLVITGWTGSTVYYKLDDDISFTNSGSDSVNLDVSSNYLVTFYVSDGANTTEEEEVWVGTGIKKLDGTNFSVITRTSGGASGGEIKRV